MKQLLCALRDASLLCLSFPLPHDMMRSRNEMTKEKRLRIPHTQLIVGLREKTQKSERTRKISISKKLNIFKSLRYILKNIA